MDTLATIKELYTATQGGSVYEIGTENGQPVKIEYHVKQYVHPISSSQIDAQLATVLNAKAELEALKTEVANKEAVIAEEKVVVEEETVVAEEIVV